jgi:hypothetical protein
MLNKSKTSKELSRTGIPSIHCVLDVLKIVDFRWLGLECILRNEVKEKVC